MVRNQGPNRRIAVGAERFERTLCQIVRQRRQRPNRRPLNGTPHQPEQMLALEDPPEGPHNSRVREFAKALCGRHLLIDGSRFENPDQIGKRFLSPGGPQSTDRRDPNAGIYVAQELSGHVVGDGRAPSGRYLSDILADAIGGMPGGHTRRSGARGLKTV